MNGSFTACEPAAMIACVNFDDLLAAVGLRLPCDADRRTCRCPSPPSTLRIFAMPARPPVSLPTTLSLKSRSLSRSTCGLPNVMPCAPSASASSMHERRVQQRLRRNTADVQAHAAERRVAFDEHRLHAEVGGAERGRVTAGAGAEHEHVALDIGGAGVAAAAWGAGAAAAGAAACGAAVLRLGVGAAAAAARAFERQDHDAFR